MTVLWRREDWHVNAKPIYRVYQEKLILYQAPAKDGAPQGGPDKLHKGTKAL